MYYIDWLTSDGFCWAWLARGLRLKMTGYLHMLNFLSWSGALLGLGGGLKVIVLPGKRLQVKGIKRFHPS